MKFKLSILGACLSFYAHATKVPPSVNLRTPPVNLRTPPSTPERVKVARPYSPSPLKVKLESIYGEELANKLCEILDEAAKLGDSWVTGDWALKIWAIHFNIPTNDLELDSDVIKILTSNSPRWESKKRRREEYSDLMIVARKQDYELSHSEYVSGSNIKGLVHPRLLRAVYEDDPEMLELVEKICSSMETESPANSPYKRVKHWISPGL